MQCKVEWVAKWRKDLGEKEIVSLSTNRKNQISMEIYDLLA